MRSPASAHSYSEPKRASGGGLVAALRPARLPASFLGVALGGALAIGEPGPARWPVWGAVALATLFLHAGGLLFAEIADRRRARANAWQMSRARSNLSSGALALAAVACFAIGAFLGFLGVIERGWPLFWMGVVGILGAIVYSQGPALRDRLLGAPLAFFLLGPLPAAAGFLAVTGRWQPLAARLALPLGFLAAATVLAREVRDVVDDARAGATTLAGVMHRPLADYALYALLAAPYLWLLGLALRGMVAWANLAPWLTLPSAILVARLARSHPEEGSPELDELPERAGRLYIRFAVLYVLSLVVSQLIWQRAA
ncbi:MAG TPA: prenyltransferase [Candidatus Eisenbacteria bacterium]|nr:prenyltransferase [Candidatus Eisenbacteria bacterium]